MAWLASQRWLLNKVVLFAQKRKINLSGTLKLNISVILTVGLV